MLEDVYENRKKWDAHYRHNNCKILYKLLLLVSCQENTDGNPKNVNFKIASDPEISF